MLSPELLNTVGPGDYVWFENQWHRVIEPLKNRLEVVMGFSVETAFETEPRNIAIGFVEHVHITVVEPEPEPTPLGKLWERWTTPKK